MTAIGSRPRVNRFLGFGLEGSVRLAPSVLIRLRRAGPCESRHANRREENQRVAEEFLGNSVRFPTRLDSSGLQICLLTAKDVDALHSLTDRREVARSVSFPTYPVPRAFIAYWVDKNDAEAAERVYGIFGDDERLMGQIGAHGSADGSEIEIGYWLGVEFWGRGAATMAACALASALQRLNGAKTIFAECAPENLASRRVLEKAGFVAGGEPGYRPGRVRLVFAASEKA